MALISPDESIGRVLKNEGWPKVTERISDLGGLTKGGVRFDIYNRWLAAKGLPPVTRAEFLELTEVQARAFFWDEFFAPWLFIDDRPIFILLGDWGVNAGNDDPAIALQIEFAELGLYPREKVDGLIGSKTRAAWAAFIGDRDALRDELVRDRVDFHFGRAYDAKVRAFLKANPDTQLHNLRGWVSRSLGFI